MTTTTPARASATWRRALAQLPAAQQFLTQVEQAQRDVGLTYRGTTILNVAEPVFITEAMLAADQRAVTAVLTTLVAAGEKVLRDAKLRARYLPHWTGDFPDADLFELPSGYPDDIVVGRLDGIRTAAGLQFLEFNGGLPGGIMPADLSAKVVSAWDVARRFEEDFRCRTLSSADRVVSALVATWHAYGGTATPYIVVGLPRELAPIAGPSLSYVAAVAARASIELDVADPDELVHSARRLRLRGRGIDVFVRGFFTTMTATLGSRLNAVRSALRAGDVAMVTSMRAGLYGDKALFAVLTDDSIDLDLPTEVRSLASAAVPWTRLLEPGTVTTPEGTRVDLYDYAVNHRKRLVIKPTTGFGGSGVHLGWEHSASSWQAALRRAAGLPGHILQAAVHPPRTPLATLAAGFRVEDFTTDANPIVAAGAIAGYYMRATATSGVTNVATGAGLVPAFIIADGDPN